MVTPKEVDRLLKDISDLLQWLKCRPASPAQEYLN